MAINTGKNPAIEDAQNASSSSRASSVFPGGRFWIFKPDDFFPDMPGLYGLSVARSLAATTLIALSLALMKLIPSIMVGVIVIPLWCASVGAMLDGYRGAARGFITAIVYPIYFALIIALASLIFWIYALLHRAIAGPQILG